MRRARRRPASRRRHGDDVCGETDRNDGQAEEVLDPQPPQAADEGGSSSHGVLAIGAVGTPQPESESPAMPVQPISTSDATPSIAATAADGATAA